MEFQNIFGSKYRPTSLDGPSTGAIVFSATVLANRFTLLNIPRHNSRIIGSALDEKVRLL